MTSSEKPVTNITSPSSLHRVSIPHGTHWTCNHCSNLSVWILVCFLRKDASSLDRVLILFPTVSPVLRLGPNLPLLDDVVKLVVGLVVFQTLHGVPFALPIGLSELPDKHLEGRRRLMLGPRAPGDPSSMEKVYVGQEDLQGLLKLTTAVALCHLPPQTRMCKKTNSKECQN